MKNPSHKLKFYFSNAIRSALKGRKEGRHCFDLVGYTREQLMAHLESLFKDGMTWENYGEWHVDHIKPQSAFSFISPDSPEFKACWALSNLQPLWAKDNAQKGAKWPQPSS